jgi:single-strand DNA-binding protein
MSKQGINRMTLMGNVGHEPSVHTFDTDKSVVRLSIATSESYEVEGEKVTQTEWHTVVFFNGLANIVKEYVTKGSKMYIEGKLKTNKWVDKEGNERVGTEIIASEMQIVSARKEHEPKAEPEEKQ